MQTFKQLREACWDSHKQVGTKISSKTGKRVPNCVPKNEEIEDDSPDVVKAVEDAMEMEKKRKMKTEYYPGHASRNMPHIVVGKDLKVVYRSTRNNAFRYQEREYSNNPHLKIYVDRKARVGDIFKFRVGNYPVPNPRLKGTAAPMGYGKKLYDSNDVEESSAMRALKRRNAKNAYAKKTIAKYADAAKRGIPASQVNQRRTAVTRKKI